MKLAKWPANFVISSIILFVGLYFVVSLCVAYFKLSGQIAEGQPMYFDLQTPTWAGLVMFQAACMAIMGLGFFLRSKLRQQLQ